MPTATEYNQAVQNLHLTAADEELKAGQPALNPLGLPLEYAGGFAVVYQVRCPKTGKTWAVKCFTKEVEHRRERYEAISQHLRRVQLPFMVGFEYQEQGLLVNGRWEPIVKMDWVEGDPLNEFVAKHLEQRGTLRQLSQLWVKLARRLDAAEVAHADLQHGNVLLVPPAREGEGPRLRLVDYDGMHMPALADRPSGELGHRAYQHPQRLRDEIYRPEVDRFSHLVIYGAIHCLIGGGQDLWDRYDNEDNLLFRDEDFANPKESKLFRELWALPDPAAHVLVGRLLLATQQPLADVPRLDELHRDGKLLGLRREEEQTAASILNSTATRTAGVAIPQPPDPKPASAAQDSAESPSLDTITPLTDDEFLDLLGTSEVRDFKRDAFKWDSSDNNGVDRTQGGIQRNPKGHGVPLAEKEAVTCKRCGNSVTVPSRMIDPIGRLVLCPCCGEVIDKEATPRYSKRKRDFGDGRADSANQQAARSPSLYERFREACTFRVDIDLETFWLLLGAAAHVLGRLLFLVVSIPLPFYLLHFEIVDPLIAIFFAPVASVTGIALGVWWLLNS